MIRSEKKESIAVAVVGLGAMAWLLLAPGAFAQTQTKPAVELEAAIAKEQVNGDLKSAIAAYQKIAANNSAPRDVRAKALLHLAGCYEKLGQQAQKVYEQIVRDFADQPEAKQASAKLAASRHRDGEIGPATMTQRKIEVVGPLAGHSVAFNNTDGRSLVYRDPVTQAIMIGDLATGKSRVVAQSPAGAIDRGFRFPSRDMSMLFARITMPGGKEINAVVKMDGTGYREIPGSFSGRPDCSWDNRYLLFCQNTPDGTRRVRISAADGTVVTLPGPARCAQMFSPDGRHIASAESNNSKSGIFVGPVGGEDRLLALPGSDSGNARLMGWTPDGHYLAVAIDRSGFEALYLIPMKDGRAEGDPVFVRYGSFLIGQVFASGSLTYESVPATGQWATWIGTLDSVSRVTRWEALPLSGGRQQPTAPAWSPDGNRIAYVASNAAAGQNSQTVRLHDLNSGDDRELYTSGPGEMNCVWAKHPANLFCGKSTPENTTDLYSISTDSGSARLIGSVARVNHPLDVTPDDSGIYMASAPGAELNLWDIATREMALQGQGNANVSSWVVASPDKRWISRLEKGQTEVRSLAGGDWKSLVPGGGTQVAFSQDGNWFLYHGVDSVGAQSLFRVPVAGGQPERLGDFPAASKVGLMWLSPDGRKVIADSLSPFETWVLENFEPASPKQ
jgi:WD40 repeat protein